MRKDPVHHVPPWLQNVQRLRGDLHTGSSGQADQQNILRDPHHENRRLLYYSWTKLCFISSPLIPNRNPPPERMALALVREAVVRPFTDQPELVAVRDLSTVRHVRCVEQQSPSSPVTACIKHD